MTFRPAFRFNPIQPPHAITRTARLLAPALFAFLLGTGPAAATEPTTWDVRHDADGIRVATRPVADSSVLSFRAEIELDASPEAVLAVITDTTAFHRWIDGCADARYLDRNDFYLSHTYQINDLPWPAQDRDMVFELKIEEIANGGFRMDLTSRPDRLPETEYYRIQNSGGYYVITPLASGRVHVEWVQHADPGGNLPGWLVNQMLLDIPIKGLNELRHMVLEPAYRDRQLLRDDAGRIIDWVPNPTSPAQVGVL